MSCVCHENKPQCDCVWSPRGPDDQDDDNLWIIMVMLGVGALLSLAYLAIQHG